MPSKVNSIRYLRAAVEEFRKLDPVMPAQTMAHFLVIAERAPEEIGMKELAGMFGLSQSSTSRNVAYLGKVWKTNSEGAVPGLDLVEAYEDPMERRRKLVRMTPKGKRVAEALAGLIPGGGEGG
jgi:DNA-binding MarR family transcriptional regulator